MDERGDRIAGEARRAWVAVGGPIIGLVAVVLLLAVAAFAGFARQQDHDYADASRRLVTSALAARLNTIGDTALDYANWNDAYAAISARWDQAWIARNYYTNIADALVVFRANGQVRYAWAAAPEEAQSYAVTAVRAALAIPDLATAPNAPTIAQTVRRTMTLANGELVLIGIAPVALEDNRLRLAAVQEAPADYVAIINRLDPQSIAAMGAGLDLEDFKFAPGAAAAPDPARVAQTVAVADQSALGRLSWRHARPGTHGFYAQIAPVLLCLVLAGALSLLVAHALVSRHVRTMSMAHSALEASRHKSEFIATMSHELRTPLNSIIGYAELIQEEAPSEPNFDRVRGDTRHIVSAARQLRQLVDDVIDHSRIDAGGMHYRYEDLQVSELLAEVADILQPLAEARGNSILVAAGVDELYVRADHLRLRQSLLNLVGNAIKFTKQGEITLGARQDQAHDKVVLEVSDTGVGIARHDLERLFQPFVQSGSDKGGGAGLGLSISRKLVRAMGGDISVSSQLGAGSTFKVAMPAARAAEAA